VVGWEWVEQASGLSRRASRPTLRLALKESTPSPPHTPEKFSKNPKKSLGPFWSEQIGWQQVPIEKLQKPILRILHLLRLSSPPLPCQALALAGQASFFLQIR
jgi:hypothetical protein